jgi:hypothetical protein
MTISMSSDVGVLMIINLFIRTIWQSRTPGRYIGGLASTKPAQAGEVSGSICKGASIRPYVLITAMIGALCSFVPLFSQRY